MGDGSRVETVTTARGVRKQQVALPREIHRNLVELASSVRGSFTLETSRHQDDNSRMRFADTRNQPNCTFHNQRL